VKTAERRLFFDVYTASLTRQGEELCGDQVKLLRRPDQTIVVLSDGLGSGVKANILARLTTEIIVTMWREEAPLQDVMETVAGTLPICRVQRIAYATFAIVEIQHATGRFRLISYESPPPLFIKRGALTPLPQRTEQIQWRGVGIATGVLERGDFLALPSDGVLFAGSGVANNLAWGPDQVGAYLLRAHRLEGYSAEVLVKGVLRQTQALYGAQVGDDATLVGILARLPNRLMVFTGPPTDPAKDAACVERLLAFEGRKVACGGTTGQIVATQTGQVIETDQRTLRDDLPPIGRLPDLDLLTEGILTLAKTLHLLEDCRGESARLPTDRNGAVLLARELLAADSVFFLAGETVNPEYQSPLLPQGVSIRRTILERIVSLLGGYHKAVEIEWC